MEIKEFKTGLLQPLPLLTHKGDPLLKVVVRDVHERGGELMPFHSTWEWNGEAYICNGVVLTTRRAAGSWGGFDRYATLELNGL